MTERRVTRREALLEIGFYPFALSRLAKGLRYNFLPSLENKESLFIESGDTARDEYENTYLIKQEISRLPDGSEKAVLCRYLIPDFEIWRKRVDYRKDPKIVISSLLELVPLKEVPKDKFFRHWDGTIKTPQREGGLKIIPIAGLGTVTGDNTFSHILPVLSELGYKDRDILDPTYKIDLQKPLLGLPYSLKESTQDPLKSFYNMNQLLDLWKKQFPLEKFWLLGHSQGGWLALWLAAANPDCIAGVIGLDAAMVGADLTPFSIIERFGARIFGGEAGEYFINLGEDEISRLKTKEQVNRIKQKGIVFVSFSSSNDRVVRTEFTLAEMSDTLFSKERVSPVFPMESWAYWDIAKEVSSQTPSPQLNFDPDKIDSQSAQMRPGESVSAHGAVLINPQVLESLKTIIPAL
ncbi:MAG: alpha/beta hydrolase [bacterium]|nr:alpha/beta hydrolase [bacterium]